MPIPTPSEAVKITLIHGLSADVSIGTSMFWSYSGGAPSPANCVTLAAAVASAWNGHLSGLMSNNGVLESVTVVDLASNAGNEGNSPSGAAGTRSGSEVSLGASLVALYKIARHYRGGKPKGFWPFGITSDLVAGNTWSSTFITSANSAFAAFAGAVNGSTAGSTTLGTQQNVSYFQGSKSNPAASKWARRNIPNPRSTPLVEPVTSIACASKLGSQRRRLKS